MTESPRMLFKDWLEKTGFSMTSLAKLCRLSTSTILNLSNGKTPLFRTVKRLVRVTKNFKQPIEYGMFPVVFSRKSGSPISMEEKLKTLQK
jgi:transcriptional regulator with XRE-family HTH domain